MPKTTKNLKVLPTKQDEESLVKIHDNLPSIPGCFLLIAPPASGKSTIIANCVFNLYNEGKTPFFKRVIWISPTILTDRSLAGVRKLANDPDNDEIEIQLITGEHLNDLEQTIEGIIEYIKDMKEEDKDEGNIRTALIIDDSMCFMQNKIMSQLTRLTSTYRHIGHSLSIFLATQTYKGCPKAIREMASCIIICGNPGGKTRKEICEDMEDIFGDDFEKYLNEVLKTKYNFLMCDMRELKLYECFEKLIYSKN
jgi:hypothetical protein